MGYLIGAVIIIVLVLYIVKELRTRMYYKYIHNYNKRVCVGGGGLVDGVEHVLMSIALFSQLKQKEFPHMGELYIIAKSVIIII